jgi:hypothetical protein|tara:strand:- start:132 stop:314 length:183 start_codon:yes stop_codon:yes gene_type:complete
MRPHAKRSAFCHRVVVFIVFLFFIIIINIVVVRSGSVGIGGGSRCAWGGAADSLCSSASA